MATATRRKTPENSQKNSHEDSKTLLLQAGKRLFSAQGLTGTTVRDLARAAGVNLCMVSYHFGGKEGLYRACIDEFGKNRLQNTKNVLTHPESHQDFKIRLGLLVRALVNSIVEEPELYKMLMRELEDGLPIARDVYEKSFLILFNEMIGFFKSAQKAHFVRSDADPFYLCMSIYANVGYLFRTEALCSHYFHRSVQDPKEREKMIQSLLSLIIHGTSL